ncbi:hypothetical protein FO519_003506 [Halicephalobus sp. NKZ332]|nr:hypothetical protein FO519_003506 [Halicephalobus sp. NKZ332]
MIATGEEIGVFLNAVYRNSLMPLSTGKSPALTPAAPYTPVITGYNHPARFLTDFNNPERETWWQSDTMLEGVQYPNNVTLTLVLGKAFDITYVRLKFVSARPESFAIYKKTTADGEWIPWQFYSGSCKSTYKMPDKAPVLPGNEAVAQCTREFSDISPLTGGNIAFSTLDGRPSAENFEESDVLQEWVTAVAIRIVLNRLNTFGDEVFQDQRVLKTYYYAISDLTVGGRCKCNGHANSCVASTGEGVKETLVCQCQHNTDGPDCERCSPFFQDRPWRRGTAEEPNECLPCNCNGLSSRCFFDETLYNNTGHGGHCVDCTGNTDGPNCEKCVPGYYKLQGYNFCEECGCDSRGSHSGNCNDKGQCECKPGVTGLRCDQCESGFFDFSSSGCKDCHCEASGSWDNQPRCSPLSGDCQCKINVEGQKCDKCKPGYFNLSLRNQFGCTPCFCFGHSSICSASEGYYGVNVSSTFIEGSEKWTASSERRAEDVQWAQLDRAVAVSQIDYFPVFFYSPSEFLGDLRFSFNQYLTFKLRLQLQAASPSNKDLIIVSNDNEELTIPITGQGNPLPSTSVQVFRFLLHPRAGQWSPNLSEIDFIKRLSNVTAIKIRGTYSRGDVGFLNFFSLGSASHSPASLVTLQETDWVESCSCPEGHVGQFCESCAPGYRRAVKFGGPLTKCIKCDCHGHSDSCDAESGTCICQHNTSGDTCESCARGYYGNALNGTENDCQKCDCPESGPCAEVPEGGTVCTECPLGYSGIKCEHCASEYYGNPAEGRPCLPCPCNGNIDYNAIGNCDSFTGECKKCIYNTTGFNCENCLSGFWGDAKKEPKNDCRECSCYPPGTKRRNFNDEFLTCDQETGQCECLSHVTGTRCDQCELGFFNITSGAGCLSCGCDPLGSEDQFCDAVNGKCKCKPGVTGLKCDQCIEGYFGFSTGGCKPCECDSIGSESSICDKDSGQCLCKDNVEGRRCDQCSENRFNMRAGCLPCDDCYTLIQSRRDELLKNMSEIETGLEYWENNPVKVDDEFFLTKIEEAQKKMSNFKETMDDYLDEDSKSRIKNFLSLIPAMEKSIFEIRNLNPTLNSVDSTLDELELYQKEFENVKSTYQKQMDSSLDKAKERGKEVLEQIREKVESRGEGSGKLYEIATEADELAKKQQKLKEEIKEKTEQYTKTVKNAHNEAYNAVHGDKLSPQVAQIEETLKDMTDVLKKTVKVAQEVGNETEKVHTDAAKALVEIESLEIPEVDIDLLEETTRKNKENLKEEKKKIEDILKEKKEIEEKVSRVISEAKNQTDALKNNQKKDIIHQIETETNKTKGSIKNMVDSMAEAMQILTDLENFEENNRKNKELFLEEFGKVSETRKNIKEANEKSRKIEKDLGNSESLTKNALKLAKEAQDKAESLADEANQILEAVKILESKTKEVKNTDFVSSLNEALDRAEEQKEKSGKIKEFVQLSGRKAAEVELKAKKGNETLNDLEETLESVKTKLNFIGNPPSEEDLQKLEKLLDEADKSFKTKKIRRNVKKLKNREIEKDINFVKSEYDQLRKELDQMRRIYESLPSKCYNIVRIEQ